jgi:adenylyl-sulfate kinase
MSEIRTELNDVMTIWFTGLSGAGKTTLATRLSQDLENRGLHVKLLDGDEVRKLTNSRDFSREGRDRNVRNVGRVARTCNSQGKIVVCSLISPYEQTRNEVRNMIGRDRFVLVYLESDLQTLILRDVKGLYKKAIKGEIKAFTGISDPYEIPEDPDLVIDTSATSVDESYRILWEHLQNRMATLQTKGSPESARI